MNMNKIVLKIIWDALERGWVSHSEVDHVVSSHYADSESRTAILEGEENE